MVVIVVHTECSQARGSEHVCFHAAKLSELYETFWLGKERFSKPSNKYAFRSGRTNLPQNFN